MINFPGPKLDILLPYSSTIMTEQTVISCSTLASRNSFEGYTSQLKAFANNDVDRLGPCKAEIFNALWGATNSDFASVGVSSYYLTTPNLCCYLYLAHMYMLQLATL